VPIAVASVALTVAIFVTTAYPRAVHGWSLATAYVALGLAALTLAIGPIRALRGLRVPLSIDLRRDIGIWAALVGLAHVVLGLQVHLGGDLVRYFAETSGGAAVRFDAFGLGNYTGLAATLLLALLLALSSNRALRALGGRRWKRLHRLNYALFALVAAHGLLYQVVEDRAVGGVATLLLVVTGVMAVQAAGFHRRRASRARA